MFRSILRKFTKEEGEVETISRKKIEDWFPLKEEEKERIEQSVKGLIHQMHGDEMAHTLLAYQRNFPTTELPFFGIRLDVLGMEREEHSQDEAPIFKNDSGDVMLLGTVQPNGKLIQGQDDPEVYRDWIRHIGKTSGEGIVLCEPFRTENGIEGMECITKVLREGQPGMDYMYFINISHFEEQMLYQIRIKVFEKSPTGLRDNLLIHPLSKVMGMSVLELSEVYHQDPYDENITEGNLMNLSEREEFDALFPFHPLSVIRQEIRPALLKSLQFKG